jgi:hypothetical protein
MAMYVWYMHAPYFKSTGDKICDDVNVWTMYNVQCVCIEICTIFTRILHVHDKGHTYIHTCTKNVQGLWQHTWKRSYMHTHTHIHTQGTIKDEEAFQVQIENDARLMAANMEKAMIMLQKAARGWLIRRCVCMCAYVCIILNTLSKSAYVCACVRVCVCVFYTIYIFKTRQGIWPCAYIHKHINSHRRHAVARVADKGWSIADLAIHTYIHTYMHTYINTCTYTGAMP